jgi:hypothetical protein
MDKFLDLAFSTQILDTEDFETYFEPFLTKLKGLLSDEMYGEFEEELNDCVTDCVHHFGVQGMKLAIGIIDGSYIPTI